MGGRIDIEADDVFEFICKYSLKVRMRCGASWLASRMRCTDRRLTPAAFANIRPVQCVTSAGGDPSARSITRRCGWQWLLAGLAGFVAQKAIDALAHEALLP